MKKFISGLFYIFPITFHCLVYAQQPGVEDIRDFILKPESSEFEVNDLDFNKDDKVDIADLIFYSISNGQELGGYTEGNYIGVIQSRSIAGTSESQSESTLPIEIIIDSLSPLGGKLSNKDGAFSFYFPAGDMPLQHISIEGSSIEFSFSVSGKVDMVSGNVIERSYIFSGELNVEGSLPIVIGDYQEVISGFSDVKGQPRELRRGGKFMLSLTNLQE